MKMKNVVSALAAGLLIMGAAVAHGGGFSRHHSELPQISSPSTLGRIAQSRDPSLAALSNGTTVGRLSAPVYESQLHRLLTLEAMAGVAGRLRECEETLYRFIPRTQLPRLAEIYRRVKSGDVERKAAVQLNVAHLKNGVVLPNGWVMVFKGANDFWLTNPATGEGVRIWGDPHFDRVENHTRSQHYGDYTSNCMVLVFPEMLLLLESTGGSPSDGFGLPTTLTAISKDKFVFVRRLNSGEPVGESGEGGIFAAHAFLAQLRRAHVLYWIPSAGELRTADGSRPAPPAGARSYQRAAPTETIKPYERFALDTTWLAAAETGVERLHLEVLDRARQALAAKSYNDESLRGLKAVGESYSEKLVAYAKKMHAGILEREQISSRLAKLADLATKAADELESPATTNARSQEISLEIEKLEIELNRAEAELRKVEEQKPSPPESIPAR
ncbi:MAG: hypothetical protein KY475_16710 [Planctomycetes bacterium]|nr:hypothetical protein [Planctomycetota bacterium]